MNNQNEIPRNTEEDTCWKQIWRLTNESCADYQEVCIAAQTGAYVCEWNYRTGEVVACRKDDPSVRTYVGTVSTQSLKKISVHTIEFNDAKTSIEELIIDMVRIFVELGMDARREFQQSTAHAA